MEGLSNAVYKGYWRRKGYERLSGGGRKQKVRVVQLASAATGEGSRRRRRFWRIKLIRRLKLKLRFSPKKFLIGLRDAYVNMMMKFAHSSVIGGGCPGDGSMGFGLRPVKEYDEQMIVEIYKSIVMAQGQLAWIGSQNTFRR